MQQFKFLILFGFALLVVASCETDTKPKVKPSKGTTPKTAIKMPSFSQDSAYAHIEKQLSFGYRIPGTKEHEACKDWFVEKFKSYGAKIDVQEFKASFLGLNSQQSYNVIASFNPKAKKRLLFAAHWDSRLIAEKDEDPKLKDKPIYGADDGASGVGVLIEIARLLHENPIETGIDIVLFDAEDQGQDGENWCLGSKYWSMNPHKKGYDAKFGILLDMIGAKNARFGYEEISVKYGRKILDKVWGLAGGMGYGSYFERYNAGSIMDDHYYVNVNMGIPMIDIINRPLTVDHGFGEYHHTHKDNIDIISKQTLKAVGRVVTAVIYNDAQGRF